MEYVIDCNTEDFYCGNLGSKDNSKEELQTAFNN